MADTARIKETIKAALETSRGDDLARAGVSFSGLSEAQMREQHGQSGYTRREVLERYHSRHDQIEEALEWLENVL